MQKETSFQRKKIDIMFYLSNLIDSLNGLTNQELKELSQRNEMCDLLYDKNRSKLMYLLDFSNDFNNNNIKDKNYSESFQIEIIMNRLRNIIMHSPNQLRNASEIDWLLRILVSSPKIFPQVREIDNFLSNMTGLHHDTKSTGRDRIIDWYFKAIDNFSEEQKNDTYFNIARYLFVNLPSNYKEWKEILYKGAD